MNGVRRQRWSTPVEGRHPSDGRVTVSRAEARWHAPDREGEFAYLEITIDEIEDARPAVADEVSSLGS